MSLSEQERQILEQMEKEFRQEDPALVATLGLSKDSAETSQPGRLSPRNLAVGATLAVLGLILPIIGITLGGKWYPLGFGVTGFALMVYGVLLALRPVGKGK
ncbi:DUF3040 domain-containing protein [Gleimia sp. 6138-11-ORH1]|uniref:DUF3040 domain-containing protein n=1 Tax=Gleimia sp. 6138-11-ORH1 TaxID=2973937 RepID=UPI0021698F72|nr:DUF3040 domain-containing protein [Gleimia sp. 6138-11-ORH1]MCS4484251.1 DUF3040 domain-containing protein [Gleimia sp. 6138-11-ORH1]